MRLLKIFLLLFCVFSLTFASKYYCQMNGSKCIMTGVNVTRENYSEEPTGHDTLRLTRQFYLQNSNVPILSKELCKAMPFLFYFNATSQSIEEIEDGAFERCTYLATIDLSKNKLTKLHQNTFKGLRNLGDLYLSGNNSPIGDLDLSTNKLLEILDLKNFDMSSVSVVEMLSEKKKLQVLRLSSNNLHDIDIEGILEHCPKLKEIDLSHNKLQCERQEKNRSILTEKNIEFHLTENECISDNQ